MRYYHLKATTKSRTYFYNIEKNKHYILTKILITADPVGRYIVEVGSKVLWDVVHYKDSGQVLEKLFFENIL